MKQYIDLIKHIRENGVYKGDRTGTGTQSVFGYQMRFNLQEGFPLVTSKFTSFRLILSELLWLISGNTNIQPLLDDNNHIWDEWADENGDLGPIYGKQWRDYDGEGGNDESSPAYIKGIDQLEEAINLIKHNPNSRRIIVSAWNPRDLPNEIISPQENVRSNRMALAPCHVLQQYYVSDGKLSCQLYQRSGDVGLGIPFNIASYSLLTHMIASICDLEVGEFIHTSGDAHLYNNHKEQVDELLKRDPLPLPSIWVNPHIKNIDDFTKDDFNLLDYQHHPAIKAPVAV